MSDAGSCTHIDQVALVALEGDVAAYKESRHPIIRSVEPGEDWSWCYIDELFFRLPA